MVVKIPLGTSNYLNYSGFSKEEQSEIYEKQLNDIIENTRWYLDNLHYLVEYRVTYKNYTKPKKVLLNGRRSNGTPTLPIKYINITKN